MVVIFRVQPAAGTPGLAELRNPFLVISGIALISGIFLLLFHFPAPTVLPLKTNRRFPIVIISRFFGLRLPE